MAGAHLLAPPPPSPSASPSCSSIARSCRSSRFRFSPPASPLAAVRRRPDLDGRAPPQGQAGAVLRQSGLLGVDAVCIHQVLHPPRVLKNRGRFLCLELSHVLLRDVHRG